MKVSRLVRRRRGLAEGHSSFTIIIIVVIVAVVIIAIVIIIIVIIVVVIIVVVVVIIIIIVVVIGSCIGVVVCGIGISILIVTDTVCAAANKIVLPPSAFRDLDFH